MQRRGGASSSSQIRPLFILQAKKELAMVTVKLYSRMRHVAIILSLWLAVINPEMLNDFSGNNVKGQAEVLTDGESGHMCGKDRCVHPGVCVNNTCVCPACRKGDGRIGCFRNNTFVAQIVGDPVMTTYDGERVHVQFPCRFKLTQLITPHNISSSGGTCEIEMYGLNFFTHVGYYLMGFDCLVKITDNARPGTSSEISIRTFGLEVDGRWKYLVQGKNTINQLTPWGPPSKLTFMDAEIDITFDEMHNFAQVMSDECGFEVRFRAFVRGSHQLPGLAVSVENRPGLRFVKENQTSCTSPFHVTTPFLSNLKRKLKLTKVETLLYLALNQNTRQDFGFGAVPCNVAARKFLMLCSSTRERAFALKMCSFIYVDKSTAQCLRSDTFGESTGSTFGMCVQAMCSEHAGLCSDVRRELRTFRCPLPVLFVNLDCSRIRDAKFEFYPDEIE